MSLGKEMKSTTVHHRWVCENRTHVGQQGVGTRIDARRQGGRRVRKGIGLARSTAFEVSVSERCMLWEGRSRGSAESEMG